MDNTECPNPFFISGGLISILGTRVFNFDNPITAQPSQSPGDNRVLSARYLAEVFLARPEPQPVVDDPSRMVAKTLRAAAISDLRLHPDRKAEIKSRVKSIRTLQDAGAYIEEVEKELEDAGVEA